MTKNEALSLIMPHLAPIACEIKPDTRLIIETAEGKPLLNLPFSVLASTIRFAEIDKLPNPEALQTLIERNANETL